MILDYDFKKELPNKHLVNRIKLLRGDILVQQVNAVVTAIPKSLEISGQLNSDLIDMAGNSVKNQLESNKFRVRVRTPIMLPGGKLEAENVIFQVVPDWSDSDMILEREICNFYGSAMECAADNEVTSIAFPGLVTASFTGSDPDSVRRFPMERATKAAIYGIMTYMNEIIEEVRIITFNTEAELYYSMQLCDIGWDQSNNLGSCGIS